MKPRKYIYLFVLILAVWALAACTATPAAPTEAIEEPAVPTETAAPPPTEPPAPTEEPQPTENPIIDPAALRFGDNPFNVTLNDGGRLVSSLAFSPDSKYLAMAGVGHIAIIDLAKMGIVGDLEGHTGLVTGLVWNEDGTAIVSASEDGTVIVWDVPSAAAAKTIQTGPVSLLKDLPGKPDQVALLVDAGVQIWDFQRGEQVSEILPPAGEVLLSLSCSPDGNRIAGGDMNGTIYFWDSTTGELIDTLVDDSSEEGGGVYSLDWSSDGGYLASGQENGQVYIWDTESHEIVQTIEAHDGIVSNVVWLPNAYVVASFGMDFFGTIWNVETGEKILGANANSPIISAACSQDSKFVAFGNLGNESETDKWGSNWSFSATKGIVSIWVRMDT